MFITVADMHSRPYGPPPVTPVDYGTSAPGKPYRDSYGPPPFDDVDGSPRRLRYIS